MPRLARAVYCNPSTVLTATGAECVLFSVTACTALQNKVRICFFSFLLFLVEISSVHTLVRTAYFWTIQKVTKKSTQSASENKVKHERCCEERMRLRFLIDCEKYTHARKKLDCAFGSARPPAAKKKQEPRSASTLIRLRLLCVHIPACSSVASCTVFQLQEAGKKKRWRTVPPPSNPWNRLCPFV